MCILSQGRLSWWPLSRTHGGTGAADRTLEGATEQEPCHGSETQKPCKCIHRNLIGSQVCLGSQTRAETGIVFNALSNILPG